MCGVLHRVREHQRLLLTEAQPLRTEQAGERHGKQRGGAGTHKADAIVFLAYRAVVPGAQTVRFQAHVHSHGEGVQIPGILFRKFVLDRAPFRIEEPEAVIALRVDTRHGDQCAEPPGFAGLRFTDGLGFHDQIARAGERHTPPGASAVSAVDRWEEAAVMHAPIVAPCKRNGRRRRPVHVGYLARPEVQLHVGEAIAFRPRAHVGQRAAQCLHAAGSGGVLVQVRHESCGEIADRGGLGRGGQQRAHERVGEEKIPFGGGVELGVLPQTFQGRPEHREHATGELGRLRQPPVRGTGQELQNRLELGQRGMLLRLQVSTLDPGN